jgi:hypothetical protein
VFKKAILQFIFDIIKDDLKKMARDYFVSAFAEVFSDLRQEEINIDLQKYGIPGAIGDRAMYGIACAIRDTIGKVIAEKSNEKIEYLSAISNSLPERVRNELMKESVIDAIIAKINSKQLIH